MNLRKGASQVTKRPLHHYREAIAEVNRGVVFTYKELQLDARTGLDYVKYDSLVEDLKREK